ncbi:hypothetical protein Hte_011240 [Hypoxylon texense]
MPAIFPCLVCECSTRFAITARCSSRFAVATKPAHQVVATAPRRATSWIAWEQPNPALYAPPTRAPPSSEAQEAAAGKAQGTRSVGKTVTAPATAPVAGGSHQEVSVSGKTMPPSIPARSSRALSGQTRSVQTLAAAKPNGDVDVDVVDRWTLPTTLLRIPDVTSTWPGETPAYPDQKRVRKLHHVVVVHENAGPSSRTPAAHPAQPGDTTSSRHDPSETKSTALLSTVSSVLLGLQALKENPESSYPSVSFRQAVLTYMDGVQSREEARAAVKDLEDALLVMNALEKEGSEKKK